MQTAISYRKIYNDTKAHGATPKEAAMDVLDIFTNGSIAAWDDADVQKEIQMVIDSFEK